MKATDTVVIGGGVIGTAVAYYLGTEGAEVTLCDTRDIAGGTSSACDGQVLVSNKKPGYDSDMALKSQALLEAMAPDLPIDIEHAPQGSLLPIDSEDDLGAAQEYVDRQRAVGLPMELLDRQETRSECPALAGDMAGAVLCPQDSVLNPMALAFATAEGARQRGAHIHAFTEVLDIELNGDGAVSAVVTSRGKIPTRCAVIAAGVWSRSLGEKLGLQFPVRPRKGHVLVAQRGQPPYQGNMQEFGYVMTKSGQRRTGDIEPEMEEYGVAFVYEATPAGNFLVGSSREFVGMSPGSNPEIMRLIARRAVRFLPEIADVNVIRTYTGFRPWTADGRPIISEVKEVPGLYVATGHEGDGICLAAVSGRLMADMITGTSPIVDPSPLSLDRFTCRRC